MFKVSFRGRLNSMGALAIVLPIEGCGYVDEFQVFVELRGISGCSAGRGVLLQQHQFNSRAAGATGRGCGNYGLRAWRHGRTVVLSTVNHIALKVRPRQHAFEIADQLAAAFAQTTVERDRRGGTAKIERDLLRASGLLNVTIPDALGGWGMEWAVTMKLIRVFARVDSSIAHLYGFQHLMLASISLYGSWPQTEELFSETVRKQWFWGNALNPLDKRTSLTAKNGAGYVIHGRKGFCSGALDSNM